MQEGDGICRAYDVTRQDGDKRRWELGQEEEEKALKFRHKGAQGLGPASRNRDRAKRAALETREERYPSKREVILT